VFRGSTHDKVMFDASRVLTFLTEQDESGLGRTKLIMTDLGYIGINRSVARVGLPHKRNRGNDLSEIQKDKNRVLSRNRILLENFFGRWKSLFGICQGKYWGRLGHLGRITKITIIITNWYIVRHPLLHPDKEKLDESSEEDDLRSTPVLELDRESSSDDD
jgi:hypothetical protein